MLHHLKSIQEVFIFLRAIFSFLLAAARLSSLLWSLLIRLFSSAGFNSENSFRSHFFSLFRYIRRYQHPLIRSLWLVIFFDFAANARLFDELHDRLKVVIIESQIAVQLINEMQLLRCIIPHIANGPSINLEGSGLDI